MISQEAMVKGDRIFQCGAEVRPIRRNWDGIKTAPTELRLITSKGKEYAGERGKAYIPAQLVRCSLLCLGDSFYNVRVGHDKTTAINVIGWKGTEYRIDYCGRSFMAPMSCVDVAPEFAGIIASWVEAAA